MELVWSDPGLVQNVFKSYFLSVGHAAGAFFPEKITFLDFEDMFNLKKLHFCSYFVIFCCKLKLRRHYFYDLA